MEWNTVMSAVLAGGIVGQLLTLLWGNRLTRNREYNRWLETEKHKLYSELLSVITNIPKQQIELDNWTYQIRDLSQRIHILFEGGTSPRELKSALELTFKFAQEKKDGTDGANWSDEFRTAIRELRKQMSLNIKVK